jgi:esterase
MAGSAGHREPARFDVIHSGLRLSVLEWAGEAAGPAFLFLHGGGLQGAAWSTVASLTGHARCVAPDLRGHGRSEWSGEMAYRISDHVADVSGLTSMLRLDRFVLVGHSMGGLIAMQFAAQFGAMLAGLVVVDTGVEQLGSRGAQFREVQQTGPFTSVDEAAAEVGTHLRHADPELLKPGLRRALRQRVDGVWDWRADQRPRRCEPVRMAIGKDRRKVREELHTGLSRITCQVLVIRGDRSDVLPSEGAAALAADLPDGRLVEIRGAGHNVHRDAPEQLALEITRFASTLDSDAEVPS